MNKDEILASVWTRSRTFSRSPTSGRRGFYALILILLAVLTLTGGIVNAQEGDAAPDQHDRPRVEQSGQIFLPIAARMSTPSLIEDTPWPHDGALDWSVNPDFIWATADGSQDEVVSFEIYLEANAERPSQLLATTGDNFLTPPTLQINTRYVWQVVAIDSRGKRNPGPVWTFTTESAPDPPAVGTMVRVPAGGFRMGCDYGNPAEVFCLPEEVPLHAVYLDAYYIDKYEVTNGEYGACVDAGVCNPPRLSRSRQQRSYYGNPDFHYHPVLYVSWWDAQDYCGWQGKRLPTEAEWEKAARGTIGTRVWPWGDEMISCERGTKLPENERCLDRPDTQQVGSYPLGASPYGVMDMAGNAFEWVQDLYDIRYYYSSPAVNPQGPSEVNSDWGELYDGPQFVIRGGSNMDNWYYMRTAHRHYGHHSDPDDALSDAPYFRSWRVGFRCAMSAE